MAYKFQLGAAKLGGAVTATGVVSGSALSASSPVALVEGGTGADTAAAARTNLGLAIGSDVQAYDAELAALAGLTSAADKGIQFTGEGTAATYDLTAAGKALLDDADADAQRTTLGLGSAAVKSVGVSAGNVFEASGSVAHNDFLRVNGTLIEGRSAEEVLADISAQPSSSHLTAINSMSKDDGNIIVGNGTTFVSEGGSTARASLGLAIGTDVQAYDAELAALAGLTSAANKGIQFTGAGTAATYDLTAAGKALLDDANVQAQRNTLELGTSNNVQFANITGVTGSFTGDMTISGDLTILGGVVSASVSDLLVEDRLIRIGDGLASLAAGVTAGAGFEIGNNLASIKLNTDVDGQGTDGFAISHPISTSAGTFGTVFASSQMATNDWEITSTHISGNLPITASAFVGNASSATALQTARAIGGVNFDGSAAITPQQIDIADEESTDADRLIMFADANGAQRPKNDGDFHYNPSSGLVTATAFAGNGSALTNITSTGVKLSSGKLDSGVNATGSVGSLRYVIADSGAAAMLVNLPSIAPADAGTMIIIKRVGGNNVTISSANTSQTVEGSNQDIILETNGAAVTLMASDEGDATHGGWRIV